MTNAASSSEVPTKLAVGIATVTLIITPMTTSPVKSISTFGTARSVSCGPVGAPFILAL